MPEGLSPMEVGKQLHEHTNQPHQPAASRHSRTVQIGEALLLSLVTIAAAWLGYAAAKWGTKSRLELAQAATLRNLATRADLSALSTATSTPRPSPPGSPPSPWTIPRSRPSPSGASDPSTRWPSTPGWPPTRSTTPAPGPGPATCPSTGWPTRPRPRRSTGRPWRRRRRATAPGWWVTTASGSRCLGRGAVPGRHRQHLQAAYHPLRADRRGVAAARLGHRAAAATARTPRMTTMPRPSEPWASWAAHRRGVGGGTVMRAGCRWSGPGSRRWSGTVITLDG